MVSGSGKAKASSWVAAMSVGADTVEAFKERHARLCRWNYHALPCVQQCADTAAAGNGKGKAAPAARGAAVRRRKARQEQEEELQRVMYLSNWGPNN